ncbi:MAG: hypothetical protein H0U36_06675 [Nocardioidaceae bacterium]|nr:hypothetical protein [Nocardioidaceae bacterium]
MAAGVLAGSALVGIPSLAVAGQQDNDNTGSDIGMMSQAQCQDHMTTKMSNMMDREMVKQMHSMMPKGMDGMEGMGGGMSDMSGMDSGGDESKDGG